MKYILGPVIVAPILLWRASFFEEPEKWVFYGAASLLLLFGLFCINFFRDPHRNIPADPKLLVSPADGKVIAVEKVLDPHVGRAIEIRVFLNVFDVHVQRSPFTIKSTVNKVKYHIGKFMAASKPKASLFNEQNWIYMTGANGVKVVVKQIAGLVARRIISFVKEGDTREAGEHVGLIQFGSQVDLVFPENFKPLVSVGQRVVGGETPMVEMKTSSGKKSGKKRVAKKAGKKKAAKKPKGKKRR